MSAPQGRAVVVGAGLPGLLCALELNHAGWKVTVLDRGYPGGEASGASAGILSPLPPWRYPVGARRLSRWSQNRYPVFLQELARETGRDLGYHSSGMLVLDEEPEAVEAWAEADGAPLRWIEPEAMPGVEPLLAPQSQPAAFLPDVGHVHVGRLVGALVERLTTRGVAVETLGVDALRAEAGRITGVETPDGPYAADAVVVAAGAWCAELLAPLGIALPVRPVRGQLIEFAAPEPALRHVVLGGPGRYLMPSVKQGVIAGSTLEQVGFDNSTTDEARKHLQAMAAELAPALAGAELVGHWAGLRPDNHDGLPYLGAVSAQPGLFLCAGLYTNGICAAPAAARILCDAVTGRDGEIDSAPFGPDRLKRSEAAPER